MKISSVEDFAIALKQEQIPVLSTVPSDVLEEFRLNLRFVNERLAHAEYSMLHGHIPDDKLSELFSYFGIDHARFELIKDSSCVGSRCFVHPGSFCDPEVCER